MVPEVYGDLPVALTYLSRNWDPHSIRRTNRPRTITNRCRMKESGTGMRTWSSSKENNASARRSSMTMKKNSMTIRKSNGTMRKDDLRGENTKRRTWKGTSASVGQIRNTIARSKWPRQERDHCHLTSPPPRRHWQLKCHNLRAQQNRSLYLTNPHRQTGILRPNSIPRHLAFRHHPTPRL